MDTTRNHIRNSTNRSAEADSPHCIHSSSHMTFPSLPTLGRRAVSVAGTLGLAVQLLVGGLGMPAGLGVPAGVGAPIALAVLAVIDAPAALAYDRDDDDDIR